MKYKKLHFAELLIALGDYKKSKIKLNKNNNNNSK